MAGGALRVALRVQRKHVEIDKYAVMVSHEDELRAKLEDELVNWFELGEHSQSIDVTSLSLAPSLHTLPLHHPKDVRTFIV